MRYALCISGLIREAKLCYPTLVENLIKPNPGDWDIFISTWKADLSQLVKEQPKDDCSFDEMLDLYKPKSYVCKPFDRTTKHVLFKEAHIQEFWNWVKKEKLQERSDGRWAKHSRCNMCGHKGRKGEKCRICGGPLIYNMLGQQYGIWRANELAKQASELLVPYDVVIRSRFDNYFIDKVKLEVKPNTLYIPAGYDDFSEFGGGYNDQIFWGDECTMNYFCFPHNMLGDIFHSCVENGWAPTPHSAIKFMFVPHIMDKLERPIARYLIYKKKEKHWNFITKLTDEEYRDLRV